MFCAVITHLISAAYEHILMAVGGLPSAGRNTLCIVSGLLAAGFHHPCGQDERKDPTYHPAHAPRTRSHQPSPRGATILYKVQWGFAMTMCNFTHFNVDDFKICISFRLRSMKAESFCAATMQ